jgi:SAM-dependent methyltransferase
VTAASDEELVAYRNGAAWTEGPQAVYDRLAVAALAHLPERLDGRKALDVGAGTGAATRELLRRGCDVVAADMSTSMLAELDRQTGGRVPTVVADIRHLGLADDGYDVTIAAFVLNHLDQPADGVRELARVTRPGGQVIATTFGEDDHPTKPAIEEVLVRHGWEHPAWYLTMKRERMPLIATVEAFAAVGVAGGLRESSVDDVWVDLADLPIEAIVAYRLGMPHTAPFIDSLGVDQLTELRADIAAAIKPLPPMRPRMLVLRGQS